MTALWCHRLNMNLLQKTELDKYNIQEGGRAGGGLGDLKSRELSLQKIRKDFCQGISFSILFLI
jgi:hypothetical protein